LLVGVAVGGGWQGLVAYINLGSYYAFGIPLGYVLGYVANLGVMVIKLSTLITHLNFKSLFAIVGSFFCC